MAVREFGLPIKGISKGFPSDKPDKLASEYMNNIRVIDTLEHKIRIGQRPAFDKWGAGTKIGDAENPVVAMCTISSIA